LIIAWQNLSPCSVAAENTQLTAQGGDFEEKVLNPMSRVEFGKNKWIRCSIDGNTTEG
jgi:hypothetical protein